MMNSGQAKPGPGKIEAGASVATLPAADGNRSEDMAAIREVLSELERGVQAGPPPDAGSRPLPTAEEPRPRAGRRDDPIGQDAIPGPMADHGGKSSAAGQTELRRTDVAGLRRSHEKRAKAMLRSNARRRKSGAFRAGFMLVTAMTAAMVGLYVMHPQITAASPQMAPVLDEYVVTVDGFRVELNEKATEWSARLAERVGTMTGGESAAK